MKIDKIKHGMRVNFRVWRQDEINLPGGKLDLIPSEVISVDYNKATIRYQNPIKRVPETRVVELTDLQTTLSQ